jgi:type I restriction enzyme S subunit
VTNFFASIPTGWRTSPLKSVTKFLGRGSAPVYIDDGPVHVVNQAVNRGIFLDWSKGKFHDSFLGSMKPKGFLEKSDIIVNSTGTGTLGRVGFFEGSPDGRPAVADSHLTVVRVREKDLMARYAYYVLSSSQFYDFMYSSMVVGSTNQIELSRERLASAVIPFPGLEEQFLISSFLDMEVGRIDRLVAARQRQLGLFGERASSLLSERLIPGSVSDATGNFPWPWLPTPREDVPLVRLGYVCQVQGGVTVDASRKPSDGDVTKPYLRVANVKADRLDLESVTSITVPKSVADRSTLFPGDVLMTEGGDIDKLGRGTVWRGEIPDALHQNHVFALRPDPTRLDAEYLALLTRSVHGRCYFEATGVRSTNLASTSSSKVRSFPIPLPSLKEQRSAVMEVNSALEGASQLRDALESQISLLEERKRALITAAVTGQIDVTTARGADVS